MHTNLQSQRAVGSGSLCACAFFCWLAAAGSSASGPAIAIDPKDCKYEYTIEGATLKFCKVNVESKLLSPESSNPTVRVSGHMVNAAPLTWSQVAFDIHVEGVDADTAKKFANTWTIFRHRVLSGVTTFFSEPMPASVTLPKRIEGLTASVKVVEEFTFPNLAEAVNEKARLEAANTLGDRLKQQEEARTAVRMSNAQTKCSDLFKSTSKKQAADLTTSERSKIQSCKNLGLYRLHPSAAAKR